MNDEVIGLLPQFIQNLNRLQPEYSHGDRIWQLPIRTGAKPKDWVGVYRETLRNYPLTMRYGIVPKSVIWKYYPDSYRPDVELGDARTAGFIGLVRAYKFREEYNGHHKKMTLGLFMRYCKLAYLANPDQFKGAIAKEMSGLKMYQRFADGRDEGLSGLPPNSEGAFSKWYQSRRGGGHPWEICRGGAWHGQPVPSGLAVLQPRMEGRVPEDHRSLKKPAHRASYVHERPRPGDLARRSGMTGNTVAIVASLAEFGLHPFG